MEGDLATIGITDHAQKELTDIVFVELPEKGKSFKAGDACAVVESVKTASDIYSPVSGEVVEVNEPLPDKPELINESAFGEGWLFKVKLADAAELDKLLGPEDYRTQIGG